jgi:CheY-like chemotaxis protein
MATPTGDIGNILIVEDNPDTAQVLKYMLSSMSYHVDSAFTIAEALELALHTNYALIISDISLPDGHGISLMTAMRQFSKTPAIAVTGFGSRDDVERCRKAGFDRHLTKPVTQETLQAAVAELLQPVA